MKRQNQRWANIRNKRIFDSIRLDQSNSKLSNIRIFELFEFRSKNFGIKPKYQLPTPISAFYIIKLIFLSVQQHSNISKKLHALKIRIHYNHNAYIYPFDIGHLLKVVCLVLSLTGIVKQLKVFELDSNCKVSIRLESKICYSPIPIIL